MGERREKEPVNEVDAHVAKKYEIRRRIGKGAYGIVWKAIDRKTGDIVAVKKIFDAFRNETDAQRTFREIVFLLEFSSHPNIIRLLNVLKAENNKDIYLVFQFMETDLHNVIKKGGVLEDIHQRYIMYQLFRAIKYLHSGAVIHRDLKPSNVLVNSDCKVKVADFGLARSIDPLALMEPNGDPTLTNYVATRWYRAPEILLNSKNYTVGIDMWSLGCILAEMLLGHPLFPGSSTLDQIERIMNVIQPPQKQDLDFIPSHLATNLALNCSTETTTSLREILSGAPHDALNLLEKLLVFNPNKRPTADEALKHPYVARFHNIHNEPCLEEAVIPCIRDDVQLSVDVYRNKLYELIALRKNKNRTDNMCECKTSGSSSCDYDNVQTVPQNNVVKSRIITVHAKYSGGAGQRDYKDRHRNFSKGKNVSILKSHCKSDVHPVSVKPKIEAEFNEPVKVTVVAKSFEKPKARTWDIFNGKKIQKDIFLISKGIDNLHTKSIENLKTSPDMKMDDQTDSKFMNSKQNRNDQNCTDVTPSATIQTILRKDRQNNRTKPLITVCKSSNQTREARNAIKN